MSDKEERQKRLLIKEYDLVCDLTDCEYCEEKDWCSEKDGMTRQEAIERMAKAIYAENVVRCNSDDCPPSSETCDGCPIWENCKHLAKIALNSLLEVEK